MPDIKETSKRTYKEHFDECKERLTQAAEAARPNRALSEQKITEIEQAAQKEAIMLATIETMRQIPDATASEVWNAVYSAHLFRKSGIDDPEILDKALSAAQSWRKSSGHAFEEMIKLLGTTALHPHGIDIILQRDLSRMISEGQIHNEQRDIDWLKTQIETSIFDLYAIVTKEGRNYCFGCIQSKTSVRDRVTRDREPSVYAMQHFFWSIIIVFDGAFLAMPKFQYMVNGGSAEFPANGWHGLYVFSEDYTNDRIYPTDLTFKNVKEHAITAANYWLTQRQWFNPDWRADE